MIGNSKVQFTGILQINRSYLQRNWYELIEKSIFVGSLYLQNPQSNLTASWEGHDRQSGISNRKRHRIYRRS